MSKYFWFQLNQNLIPIAFDDKRKSVLFYMCLHQSYVKFCVGLPIFENEEEKTTFANSLKRFIRLNSKEEHFTV